MGRNYQRDGAMTVNGNQEGAPNYFPNSFSGPDTDRLYQSDTNCAVEAVGLYKKIAQIKKWQMGAVALGNSKIILLEAFWILHCPEFQFLKSTKYIIK